MIQVGLKIFGSYVPYLRLKSQLRKAKIELTKSLLFNGYKLQPEIIEESKKYAQIRGLNLRSYFEV